MRHGSLFSGIGGFDLAAQWMGWENVFQVEIDPFCQAVLKKNFPTVERYGDIKQFDGTKYRGAVDILTGGFPCQPFSKAGKRMGSTDSRFLWPEQFRIIEEIEPGIVMPENVFGLLRREDGYIFEKICLDMEGIGYEVQPISIPASGIGAWHRRDRVWIVAFKTNSLHSYSNGIGLHREKIDKQRGFELQHEQICLPGSLVSEGVRNGTDARVFRDSNGIPNRVDRIKSLGNAIVPQVAFEIFKAIERTFCRLV